MKKKKGKKRKKQKAFAIRSRASISFELFIAILYTLEWYDVVHVTATWSTKEISAF